jgi:hypothetical protein
MKRLIKQGYKEIDLSSIVKNGDTLDAFASRAQEFVKCLKSNTQFFTDDIVDAKFEVEPYGYDGGVTIGVWSYRYETDAEFLVRESAEIAKEAARLDRERKKKEKALAKLVAQEADYELYLKLKAKYQGEEH